MDRILSHRQKQACAAHWAGDVTAQPHNDRILGARFGADLSRRSARACARAATLIENARKLLECNIFAALKSHEPMPLASKYFSLDRAAARTKLSHQWF